MTPNELLDETIDAHGGRERWRRVAAIRAKLSSGGLAFRSRCQPNALKRLAIEVRPHAVAVSLGDFVRPGWRGDWTPALAAIRDDRGTVVAERRDPRSHFRGPLNQVYWDKLDILTFAGAALWNYLAFPFILERPGVAPTAVGEDNGALRLDVRFAPEVPTHCARQSFHLDARRRLVRHDYTAEAIGSWATGANLCLASEVVGGLRFTTRRKVFPRLGPWKTVVPFPTLVWIEIDDLAVDLLDPRGGVTGRPLLG
ncbi:hypothetical protein DFR50_116115 [Roseiarcus fermentans]|uniref:Uncharacterized protein n=1 Tax=Roseiarcus fermentans TaxID=1473586 RepID=A0A366FBT4_9HYPH|nr:hypothetical protein [Roseiarcus fermentans]RBP11420.1 hypothetical protein DFR50_116115 [Roseiarcus fermentans]